MHELQEEHSSVARAGQPSDGTYAGSNAEGASADRVGVIRLVFERDGNIAGSGADGTSGHYSIKEGRWAGSRVAWVQEYDGQRIALRGQVRRDGTIVATWASSRGMTGAVQLRLAA